MLGIAATLKLFKDYSCTPFDDADQYFTCDMNYRLFIYIFCINVHYVEVSNRECHSALLHLFINFYDKIWRNKNQYPNFLISQK